MKFFAKHKSKKKELTMFYVVLASESPTVWAVEGYADDIQRRIVWGNAATPIDALSCVLNNAEASLDDEENYA